MAILPIGTAGLKLEEAKAAYRRDPNPETKRALKEAQDDYDESNAAWKRGIEQAQERMEAEEAAALKREEADIDAEILELRDLYKRASAELKNAENRLKRLKARGATEQEIAAEQELVDHWYKTASKINSDQGKLISHMNNRRPNKRGYQYQFPKGRY